ncbi:Cytochrome d ubiquinol oxidase subunit I [Bosea sp. 62]|uniref:cytochrome ubiquinol oxidase subunit I n=1 Tax=unclassified Bosea (in: a-proteobacteria) TaxID=2653178 RepID=UPI00125658A0|nr:MULTISPECIES: cytochrome ubiquinol oxidase subunit I [unclassified Bosea (in: a-proteobacteria)]CAD5293602.1 Cytochrome d ubiquinol oxidase subunit I [Bosea sp. 7B]CAD5298389.1 Cytochrome d ubiquinol oxidase subunit I [Bosea sp. 21B]CAD5298558.1 Cytochrome d ubiquinol oxidase subunit I [Bosea sp. 46]VVT61459.1 Cytochrome d ubiquinol oxidase subunit I [Bosea sp. EC-HK365B]VXB14173.1 Cytochrome d ubiquinol oxidase subunit I [Bosea sp. 127]
MEIDAFLLSRIQFAFTISFHIVFPAFTIGLSAYIATLLGLWLKTGDQKFHLLARFWTKIFAVSFAMGVVSGIVLSYQFGTNWSRFSVAVGNVIGPLIGYEVLTAFFLEASFLGVLLFGWKRVPPWLHFLSAVIVAGGTALSGFWILSANSWMQYPAGHEVRDGIAYPVDWLKIIFNPTFPLRFAHMMTAAYLTTAFVVLATGARHLLAGHRTESARTMVRMAILMIALTAPLQAVIGDFHGKQTAIYQPAKLAAIEAHWDSSKPGALVLFAWPDEKAELNRFEIAIPGVASLLTHGSMDALFPSLKDFKVEDRPPVLIPFFAFRLMVGIGTLMIVFGWVGAWLWKRGAVFETRSWLWLAQYSWPAGFLAILSGWFVTEVGRQPWLATGILRSKDAVSPVTTLEVAISLALFVFVYCVVFAAGIALINRLIDKGPDEISPEDPPEQPSKRPLKAAQAPASAIFGDGHPGDDKIQPAN